MRHWHNQEPWTSSVELLSHSVQRDGWIGWTEEKIIPSCWKLQHFSREYFKHTIDGGLWWVRRIVNTLGGKYIIPGHGPI